MAENVSYNISQEDLESVYNVIHQLAASFGERALTIKGEITKLRNAATRGGLSGDGRAEQILQNIGEIEKLINELQGKLTKLKNFVDDKIGDARAKATNLKGTADTNADIKKTAADAATLKKA
jgi:hypothetical protein